MADILEHILARRSIRTFTAEPVAPETLTQLLRAAMAAPSASNRRPWEFVVVTEPELLDQLRTRLPLGRYGAPVAIVVCGNMQRTYPEPARGFWIQDCSAAAQNILLAATGLGLGGVWVGVHPLKPLEILVARLLKLPRHVRPLGVLYVGHPAASKEPRTQYEERAVHWQRWE
ncbi:MAG: nitroreductase family protein [Chloroflexota bacterium]